MSSVRVYCQICTKSIFGYYISVRIHNANLCWLYHICAGHDEVETNALLIYFFLYQ
jgi:hypothetical protein